MGLFSVPHLTAEWVANLSLNKSNALDKTNKVDALLREGKRQQGQTPPEAGQQEAETAFEEQEKEAWLQELLSKTGFTEQALKAMGEAPPLAEAHHAYSLSFNKDKHCIELTHKASGNKVLTLKEADFLRMVASLKQELPMPAGVFTDRSC